MKPAVVGGREIHLLHKRTVEGAQGVKADPITDLGHALIRTRQPSAGPENPQGIDVIVKPQSQLITEVKQDIVAEKIYKKIMYKYAKFV